jgi:hypothetical protein
MPCPGSRPPGLNVEYLDLTPSGSPRTFFWLKGKPIGSSFGFLGNGVIAQLVRALPCHGRGCGFEPR